MDNFHRQSVNFIFINRVCLLNVTTVCLYNMIKRGENKHLTYSRYSKDNMHAISNKEYN